MAALSLLFILIFIFVQGALGILLLYRGFTFAIGAFEMESLTSRIVVAGDKIKAVLLFLFANWRRVFLLSALVIPGSIPLLLIVALWRIGRRIEPGIWKPSARRLKAAIQNI